MRLTLYIGKKNIKNIMYAFMNSKFIFYNFIRNLSKTFGPMPCYVFLLISTSLVFVT